MRTRLFASWLMVLSGLPVSCSPSIANTGASDGHASDSATDVGVDRADVPMRDAGLEDATDARNESAVDALDATDGHADSWVDSDSPDAPLTLDARTDVTFDVSFDHGGGASCASSSDCGTSQTCYLDACGATAVGVCGPLTTCDASFHPQCGCDGVTYQNPCIRYNRGVGLQTLGACPGAFDRCNVPSGCCAIDAQCMAGQECVLVHVCSSGSDADGVCKPPAAAPQCWRDADCPAGQLCSGPRVCPCGGTCSSPDAPGTCLPWT